MFKKFIVALFFIFLTSNIYALTIKEILKKGSAGDYIVTYQNKTYSLILIEENLNNQLIIQEISVPDDQINLKTINWQNWVLSSAPGNISWISYEIDLQTNQIVDCFSFSRNCWINFSEADNFLIHILDVPLKDVPIKDRKKIGTPPLDDTVDRRSLWTPPLVVNGEKIKNTYFEVMQLTWPKDGSDFAGKTLDLYFDKDFSFPFPYWMQLNTTHISIILRSVDSGKNLIPPKTLKAQSFPKFIGKELETTDSIELCLKKPDYLSDKFKLYAIDISAKPKRISPIKFSYVKNGDILILHIPTNQLKDNFCINHSYIWHVAFNSKNAVFAQTKDPYIWKNK